jgi:ornithine carbamoyltransferase
MKKNLVSVKDLKRTEVLDLFQLASKLKKEIRQKKFRKYLQNKTVALIFKKPSNRTLASFQVGTWQLGGFSFNMSDSAGVGVRESAKDVALTLSRYVDGIVIRTFAQEEVEELARFASVPVINALTDFEHPCQALADFFTIWEKKKGNLKKLKLAYIGDCNNVCHSLVFLADILGVKVFVASPAAYQPSAEIFRDYLKRGVLIVSEDPEEAVGGADFIYTDVWVSMGQEAEAQKRLADFKKYQINSRLMALAKKNHYVMHCLPAHRGQEITDEVIDGPNSIVFEQAENRLHVQKAVLVKLI